MNGGGIRWAGIGNLFVGIRCLASPLNLQLQNLTPSEHLGEKEEAARGDRPGTRAPVALVR